MKIIQNISYFFIFDPFKKSQLPPPIRVYHSFSCLLWWSVIPSRYIRMREVKIIMIYSDRYIPFARGYVEKFLTKFQNTFDWHCFRGVHDKPVHSRVPVTCFSFTIVVLYNSDLLTRWDNRQNIFSQFPRFLSSRYSSGGFFLQNLSLAAIYYYTSYATYAWNRCSDYLLGPRAG